MQLSEKEIEDFIYDDLVQNSGLTLKPRGFQTMHHHLLFECDVICRAKWLRQVDLGTYGRADIIGYYRHLGSIHVEIVELKSVPLCSNDFDQIFRYKKAIRHYFGERFDINFHLYLIGTDINSGHYIHNELPVTVLTYEYGLHGIYFQRHTRTWHRSDGDNFNFQKSLKNAEAIHGYR